MTTELTDQAALVAKPAARAPNPCDSSGDDGKRPVIGAGPGGLAARDSA